ncbi:hypothetical protein, partial [Staphylococcus aureus]|uniref:hypothetical protein n=1 Tax=Staphylococcus aureus TaxID=1280 RepID=UPI0004491989
KKQAIVTSQERFLASMVANLRSARVERCQAKMDAMSRIETVRSLFLCLKRQNKSKHKERWLGEVKTFESDETRKECNEFSRAK